MNIVFLEKLQKKPKIGIRKIEGVSLIDIQQVETKFKLNFPKAYKEFLFLAGKNRGALPLLDTADLETISADWHQEIMREEMETSSIVIDRPFWLFAESNGCEVFVFFYLDEETDDPNVYFVTYDLVNEPASKIVPYGATFSQYISDLIDDAYTKEKEDAYN